MYLQVDRASNGPGWDEDYDLGILAGTSPILHTGVMVQAGDRLNVKAASTEGGLTLSYVADRDPRPGESRARIVDHDLRATVRSCGGGSEGPVDVTDLYNSSRHLMSLSCWEGWYDWDFNDYVVAVDYTAGPVFLPLALRGGCTPSQRRMDVVLAIDTSSSMLERTASGDTKLEAARAAAGVFLDLVNLAAGNQAALVTFDAEARLAQALTADRSRLDIALAAMTTARQTCLPCAVAEADRELASPRRRTGNTPVLVLLTDGKSNPRPVSEAVSAAQTAKDRGVLIFTIGVGEDLDESDLAAMASQLAYFYRAPGAAALEAIYRAVAVTIPCPGGGS